MSEQTVDNVGQLVCHQLVVDDNSDLFTLLVELYRLPQQLQVLLLCPQVVKYYHLHVHPIVPLLQQSLFFALVSRLLYLQGHPPLDGLHIGSGQLDDRYGLTMLLHLAVDRSLVEVGGYNVVLLLVGLGLDQLLLQLDREVDGPHGDSILLLLLVEAGQVVEAQYLEFFDEGSI